jgi:hypothetical protein
MGLPGERLLKESGPRSCQFTSKVRLTPMSHEAPN